MFKRTRNFFVMLRFGLLSVMLLPWSAQAVTLAQGVDFSSGSTTWTSGSPNPNPPVIVVDSGPLGPGDSALRISSNGGTGSGGKLITYERTNWIGDYYGSGIDAISVDLRNTGTTNLMIRLAFNGAGGWFVTDAVSLPRFGGWTHQVFDLTPDMLIAVTGATDVNTTMTAVTEMRLLHEPSIDFRGPNVSAVMLVDNLQAVPEPTSAGLVALSGCLLWARHRRPSGFRP